MTVNYAALKAEIALSAYNGMTDAQIAAAINAASVPQVQKAILNGTDIFNAITLADYKSLTGLQLQQIAPLVSAGQAVDASQGTLVRSLFADIFAGKASLTALAALVAPFDNATVPRWVTFGFTRELDHGDIATARAS